MATILDFKDVVNITGSRITTDTEKERAMIVIMSNRKYSKFEECESGIYYYDTTKYDIGEAVSDTNKESTLTPC